MNLWAGIQELSRLPITADSGVRVWLVHIGTVDPVADYDRYLTADERQRAEGFIRPIDRKRFMVVRATLRHLLGQELGCAPEKIHLRYNQAGKPMIAWPLTTLQFNVSHTDTLALIGISRNVPIGIDIEAINPNIDTLAAGQIVFSPQEIQRLEQSEAAARMRLFLRIWTAKEAVLKMLGTGFSVDPSRICILDALEGHPVPIPVVNTHPGLPQWMHVYGLDVGNTCLAALAVGVNTRL